MYDTINFKLSSVEAKGIDFLEETPCYFDITGEHKFNDEHVITGTLNGLKISVSRGAVNIKDGSLCKWYLGDNFRTMGRGDTKQAIEKLSDTLHLPINKANISRIDIAQNFILKHPIRVYLNHLGISKNCNRLEEPDGIYYTYNGGRLCFYDKVKEQRNKREYIPELYNGRNVLRYEQRYLKRLSKQLQENIITGALLYDEAFYIKLIKKWHETYKAIPKINDTTLNIPVMRTNKGRSQMGMIAVTMVAGGQVKLLEQIKEAQMIGYISNKEAYNLRRSINEACNIKSDLTIKNEAINELDKKVSNSVAFFR